MSTRNLKRATLGTALLAASFAAALAAEPVGVPVQSVTAPFYRVGGSDPLKQIPHRRVGRIQVLG